jgi:hypothetical protein
MSLSEQNVKKIFRAGAIAAWLTVAVILCELFVTFLPGGNVQVDSVVDWFEQLQDNTFMGLRNLGLLNMVAFALGVPLYFALYIAHRKTNKGYAAFAMIISFIATSIFFATNRALSMYELSCQYVLATTEAQRAALEAAGQAALAVGRSHGPGTFPGFFLGELGGIMMSAVMLRSGVFARTTAWTGIAGFTLLATFEVCVSFLPGIAGMALFFAVAGGTLNLIWLILMGRRFMQLPNDDALRLSRRN